MSEVTRRFEQKMVPAEQSSNSEAELTLDQKEQIIKEVTQVLQLFSEGIDAIETQDETKMQEFKISLEKEKVNIKAIAEKMFNVHSSPGVNEKRSLSNLILEKEEIKQQDPKMQYLDLYGSCIDKITAIDIALHMNNVDLLKMSLEEGKRNIEELLSKVR